MDPNPKTQVDPLSWSVEEFNQYWKSLPDKGMFFALLAAWAAVFHFWGNCQYNFTDAPSLFQWMWGAWSAEALDSSQGKIIPLVVLVLLWVKREQLSKAVTGVWWPALVPLTAAALLHLCAYLVQQPRFSIIALFVGIYSMVGLVWGWRVLRASFFPYVLFVFCMPLGTFVERLTFSLRLMATVITGFISNAILGIPVERNGTQLIDLHGGFNYDVGAACSGIRSLSGLLAISTIVAMLSFRSYWRRGAMIFTAIPLAIFCNILRLMAVIISAQAWGQGAGNFVHEWFGYVTYAVAIAGTVLVARCLREKKSQS